MDEKSNKLVSIVVVTAGAQGRVFSCLESIAAQTYPSLETIVVCNPADESIRQRMHDAYPFMRLHLNPAALSYCDSVNLGISFCGGEFILCLNDDAVLDKNFVRNALEGFREGEVGMVSGKILRSDGRTIDSAGLSRSLFRTAKERGYGGRDKGQFEKAGYIFGVSGAAAFYRKEMLESVKTGDEYFDSDFHFFYEDLDLAWRAQRLGWRAYYVPSALVYHERGATARQGRGLHKRFARHYLSRELLFDLIKNRYLTIIKNERLFSFTRILPFLISYDILAFAYILLFRLPSAGYLLTRPIPAGSAFRKRAFRRPHKKIANKTAYLVI